MDSPIPAYIDELFSRPQAQTDFAPYDTANSRHVTVEPRELIELCAQDTELFGRTFFANAFRQESPSFAEELWDLLEGPARLCNAQLFRGASKTTRCRVFVMKRVAYALANTIMFVSKSERDALRSGAWIKRQIEYNRPFAQLFGLQKGSKWTDEEFEIRHTIDGRSIWIICVGITGSLRGINRDDFRPDLIVLDDINNEETSATKEQRQKISELVFGALLESLAPKSEAPHAKMVNLATPLHQDDITSQALNPKSGWSSLQIPCWTRETQDLPTHLQESVWPARWDSATLRAEKETAANNNRLSTWLREKALRITAPETASFRVEWLQRYSVLPEDLTIIMAIDPVPPPSQAAIDKNLHKNDFESMAVLGAGAGKFFLLDGSVMRGHDPSWTRAEFMRLAMKYRPHRIDVETVAYQRVLVWILQQEMKARGIYFAIHEVSDQRSKFNRIVDGISGIASNQALLIPQDAEERGEFFQMFLEQYTLYPKVSNDDVLESVAVALIGLSTFEGGGAALSLEKERQQYPRLIYNRAAP